MKFSSRFIDLAVGAGLVGVSVIALLYFLINERFEWIPEAALELALKRIEAIGKEMHENNTATSGNINALKVQVADLVTSQKELVKQQQELQKQEKLKQQQQRQQEERRLLQMKEDSQYEADKNRIQRHYM